MNKVLYIANILAIIFLGTILINIPNYLRKELSDIERLKLQYAMNLCSDAAIEEIMGISSLETDYGDYSYSSTDPQLALDTFIDLFCFNYGMSLNDNNRTLIRTSYIPAFCVATFDGFYIALPTKVSSVDYDLQFSMKYPYTYRGIERDSSGNPKLDNNNNPIPVTYSMNIGAEYCYKIYQEKSGITNLQRVSSLPFKEPINPLEKATVKLTRFDILLLINKLITDSLSYSLQENGVNYGQSFYIPNQLGKLYRTNPVDGVSLITIIDNLDLTTSEPINGFTVAGTKLQKSNYYVAYTNSKGERVYCLASRYPGKLTDSRIEGIFPNPQKAAEAGYYYDSDNMLKDKFIYKIKN